MSTSGTVCGSEAGGAHTDTTHRDTLVMRRSLVSDEDLGDQAPTALRGTLLKSAEAYH